jgi:Diacylglycerol kinase accessory domain
MQRIYYYLNIKLFNIDENNLFDKRFSRLHNKRVYLKMGLRKMVKSRSGKSGSRDLHKEIELEVDGKMIELPAVEGIIILNILRFLI